MPRGTILDWSGQRRNLVDSLDNLVAASSAGIAEALWEFDPDGIDETLERIAGLSEVVSIAVYEIPEQLIAQSGPIDDPPEADDFRRDAALTFDSGEQSESVGHLVITVTNKEIIRGISRRIALAAGIVFMVMLALTGITLVATGRVIGRPVSRLKAAIDAQHADGQRIEVDWEILVAEDNVTNQDVVRRQLALLGYAVEIANDGEEALEMMTRRHYGMLLTDCHMPNLDGYDLTRRIRENEKGSAVRLPVVAMTANALAGEAEKCLGVGMDDYMSKPVELKKLDEMIAHWMPNQNGEAEAAVVTADAAAEQAPSAPVDGSAPGDDGVIDVEVIKALLGDDMSFIMQMLNDFVPAATANAGEITDAAEAGDAAVAGAAAHKLKSSSRSMGANTLADLCEEIEKAGKAGDQATVDSLMLKLTPAFDDVTAYVETMNS
jgi:CheY-like chemotaxis protein/HPt (histidine-containing phosphotransfer) domain-containing protein